MPTLTSYFRLLIRAKLAFPPSWVAKAWLIIGLICVSLLPSSTQKIPIQSDQPTNLWLTADHSLLETGDVIFRRGNSMISNFILATDSESLYSHVGLIKKVDGKAFVIHASIDESPEDEGVVRLDPLEHFLAVDKASSSAIYRLHQEQQPLAEKAIEVALSYVNQKVLFDVDFDLSTPEKLYCTELVWRAYLEAGIDLVDGEFDHLSIPFKEGKYLLPSRLIKSNYLQVINHKINERLS